MPIPFTCPSCQKTGRLPDSFTGDKVKCPACQTISPVKKTGSKPAAPARNRAMDDEDTEPVLRSTALRTGSARQDAPAERKGGMPVALIVGGSVGTAVLAIVVALVVVLRTPSGDRPKADLAQKAPPVDSETPDPVAHVKPLSTTSSAVPTSAGGSLNPSVVASPTTSSTAPIASQASSTSTGSVASPSKVVAPVESSEQTVQRIKDATVYIEVKGDEGMSSGSGFVIQVKGDTVLIATNHHVISSGAAEDEDASASAMVTVYFRSGRGAATEQSLPGTVLAWDREANRDLAIVEVKGVRNPPKPIGLVSDIKVTETMPVLIYGFPLGNLDKKMNSAVQGGPAITVAKGSVSGLRLDEHGKTSYVQFDSGMTHGNSGGPVVDEKGQLVGLAVLLMRDSIIGLAVPTAELLKMLDGRLGRLSVAFQAEQDGKANLQVASRVIDPLKKIRDVGFLYVVASGPQHILPKLNADGTWPEIPGATRTRMTVKDQLATAPIQTPNNAGAGRRLIVQTSYLDSLGRTFYTKPISYEIPTKPTGLVAIGLPPEAALPKPKPTFGRLGSLVDISKQCKLARDENSLTIDLPSGVHLLSAGFEVKNSPMVLADVKGDFVVQVQVVGEMMPGAEKPTYKGKKLPITFQGAGLILWIDKNNYLRLERTAGTGGDLTMINKFLVEVCKGGKDAFHAYYSVPDGPLYLRLARRYNAVQCLIGPDGSRWVALPKLAVAFPDKVQVGLSASNVSKDPCSIRFEDFFMETDPKKVKVMMGR